MSKKSQHNNILLAVIGFTAVVIIVGVIGFFTLEHDDETIQGEIEVSECRDSCQGRRLRACRRYARHSRSTRGKISGKNAPGYQ